MLGQGFTEWPLIGKLRENLSTAIPGIRGDGQKLIGQKAGGAFAVDKATRAKCGLGIGDMLGHRLPKFRVGDEPLGQIAGVFIVPAEGQD